MVQTITAKNQAIVPCSANKPKLKYSDKFSRERKYEGLCLFTSFYFLLL